MNKVLQYFIVVGTIFLSGAAYATPLLQLDISNSVYVGGSEETVFSKDKTFFLYALLDYDKNANNPKVTLADTFYISASIVPKWSSIGDYGSFDFGGETIDVTDDMTYGTPPGLQAHSIFPTFYKEFEFKFDGSLTTTDYNVEDNPGNLDPSGNDLYYKEFGVDINNLLPPYDGEWSIHFDLYTKNADGSANYNNPFSHDAQSIVTSFNPPSPPPEPVPEPGTIVLLGAGLFGLGWAGRRRKNNNK